MPTTDSTIQTISYRGRLFEMRPIAGPGGAYEWREVGHGWHVAASEQNALLMIGGHAALTGGRDA